MAPTAIRHKRNFDRNQEFLAKRELPFALQSEVVNFSWGEVQEIHNIGDIWVIEYLERPINPQTGRPLKAKRRFHAYLFPHEEHDRRDDAYDIAHSYATLDESVAHAIARKHDGLNTKAHTYFLRAIGAIDW